MRRILLWGVLVLGVLGCAGGNFHAGPVYSRAKHYAGTGQDYFAFMHYKELARDFPTSKYQELSLFAVGEYYFKISNFLEAKDTFTKFLEDFPDSDKRIYALAYLLNIARKHQNDAGTKSFETQIIHLQKVSLVFRESKEVAFHSPLGQKYLTIIRIDQIEFYVGENLLAKVSY